MTILRLLRRQLTFANVAAGLALVLAMSGTAYAALAKNSVTSPTIKNGAVKSADLKDGGIQGKDLRDNGVTGADVDEASLQAVPIATSATDAKNLAGLPATSFARSSTSTAAGMLDGQAVELEIPGYGAAGARCDGNATPGVANDDLVNYTYTGLGTGTISGRTLTLASGPTTDGITRVADRIVDTGGESTLQDDRLQVDQYYRSANGAKAIRYSVWAWDDPTTTGCYAVIEAQILR